MSALVSLPSIQNAHAMALLTLLTSETLCSSSSSASNLSAELRQQPHPHPPHTHTQASVAQCCPCLQLSSCPCSHSRLILLPVPWSSPLSLLLSSGVKLPPLSLLSCFSFFVMCSSFFTRPFIHPQLLTHPEDLLHCNSSKEWLCRRPALSWLPPSSFTNSIETSGPHLHSTGSIAYQIPYTLSPASKSSLHGRGSLQLPHRMAFLLMSPGVSPK